MDAVTERGVRLGHLKTKGATKIHIDQQGGACYTSRKGATMMYTKEMQTKKKKKRMKHPKSLLHEKKWDMLSVYAVRQQLQEIPSTLSGEAPYLRRPKPKQLRRIWSCSLVMHGSSHNEPAGSPQLP